MEYFHHTHGKQLKITWKDTANPLSHQVIASLNLFSLTQAMAPVGNNTKKQIITIAQFQEKKRKPLKAKSLQTRKQNKTKKLKGKEWTGPIRLQLD